VPGLKIAVYGLKKSVTRLTHATSDKPVCRSLPVSASGPGQVKPANALSVPVNHSHACLHRLFLRKIDWPQAHLPENRTALLKVRPNSSSTFQSETSFSCECAEKGKIARISFVQTMKFLEMENAYSCDGTVMYCQQGVIVHMDSGEPVSLSQYAYQTPYKRSVSQASDAWIRSSSVIGEKLFQIVTGRGLDGRVDVGIR